MDSVLSEPCTPPSSRSLPRPFRHVLHYFTTHDVGLVVRLNSPLYEKKWFTDRGIEHLEMEFEDGTCPDLSTVKQFIIRAQAIIDQQSQFLLCLPLICRGRCSPLQSWLRSNRLPHRRLFDIQVRIHCS